MHPKFRIEDYQKSFLADEKLQPLYEEQLFKLFVPKKYGGLALNLESGVHELIRVAAIQGGLGWALNLGAGANWFSGFFSDQAAEEIFISKKAVIAGSGFANGTFRQEGDRFVISGSWARCSGAHHATFFSLKAKNDSEEVKTFVVPRDLVDITEDDWAIMGLRNASSYTISMENAVIPSRFAFEIGNIQNEYAYGVHQVPFDTFARLCLSASFVGIVQCLINHSKEKPLNTVSMRFIEMELEPQLKSTELECLKWAKLADKAVVLGQVSVALAEQIKVELAQNNVRLFDSVQQLFLKGGLPFVEEDTLVHWAYRDVLTAIQHQMVKS